MSKASLWPTTDTRIPGPHCLLHGSVEPALLRLMAGPTMAWYREALKADWSMPDDVKRQFGNASILQDGRVVFNIGGNKYRLVVWINYPYRVVYIRFLGTHPQYDRIDAQTI